MRILFRGRVLLAGACMMAGIAAWGQSQGKAKMARANFDVAVTFNPMYSNIVFSGSKFWIQGGSAQVHGQFWHGLGAVADLSGQHSGSVNSSGVGLDLLTITFGPRYTWTAPHGRMSLFGEFLAGDAHGSNSIFPASGGVKSSANSLALRAGGGIDVPLKHHISVRAFEADWLRTQLPNGTTNVQNSLRIGAGIVFHFR